MESNWECVQSGVGLEERAIWEAYKGWSASAPTRIKHESSVRCAQPQVPECTHQRPVSTPQQSLLMMAALGSPTLGRTARL